MSRIRTIRLELPPGFFGDPRRLQESEALLGELLHFMVRANRLHLLHEPQTAPLYRAGVRWSAPEGAVLASIPAIYARGRAACASLTAARVAELQVHGEARAVPAFFSRPSRDPGRVVYHVVVRRADGRIEDPSAKLGMPTSEGYMGGARWAM